MNTRYKWTSDANDVLLTNAKKVDKKGFLLRARQRGYFKKEKKGRYSTEEEGFDGYYSDPVSEEKE